MQKEKMKYIGFFGFFGFFGFRYFATGQIGELFWFSFFAFFSYFFLGKLLGEMPDERYYENRSKAKAKSAIIAVVFLFLIGWSGSFSFIGKEFMILLAAMGWAATFLVYSALFWYYEKN